MKAFVFPGQGSQYTGMGLELLDRSTAAKKLFAEADDIMGFSLSEIMFEGEEEALKETRVTQPAIFVQSVITARISGDQFNPDAVAGHSLGEFSALTAVGALSFAEGLQLVRQRALAMQDACEISEGTMAAILGLDDEVVEQICESIPDVVVPANYNSPGQLVISGKVEAVKLAAEKLTAAGAKRALILPVGGAFHSPLMAPARDALAAAILSSKFLSPICPIYQNVNAKPTSDPDIIRENLIAQLTAPVLWTQTIKNMVSDGITTFSEVGGKGGVLRGLIRKIEPSALLESL